MKIHTGTCVKTWHCYFFSYSESYESLILIAASDVNLTTRDQTTTEEMTEFSPSFLAYTAGALFLFTIFYNTLFYAVIKPAIDGPDEPPTAVLERQITK